MLTLKTHVNMILPAQFITDYSAHAEQVEALTRDVQALATISSKIPVETHAFLSYVIQRVQVRQFLRAINELNETICHAVSMKATAPAEALSRVSIEMSVNLLFILGDSPHARSKGLLNTSIEKRKSRAEKWHKFSKTAGLTSSMEAAADFLRTTELIEKCVVSSANLPAVQWQSNSREKFKAVGHEELYCTHFQSSSDSVHLLGEDILNQTIAEFCPVEDRERIFAGIAAEKQSFAIYLLIQAVLLHCEALLNLLQQMGGLEELAKQVECVAIDAQKFHLQHENDHKRHLSPVQSEPRA